MSRPITIFKAVTKNWLRSRTGLFFSILFPILLLLIFGAMWGGGGGAFTLKMFVQNQDLVSDETPTNMSTVLVQVLNSTEAFELVEVPVDANATRFARDNLGPLGGSIRILVIQKGFHEDLLNGTFKVRVGIASSTLDTLYELYKGSIDLNATEQEVLEQGLGQLQQFDEMLPSTRASLTLGLDASDQNAALAKNIVLSVASAINYQLIEAQNVIDFNEEPVTSTELRGVDFYVPGIISAFIMTNGIIALTSNTTEFKRRGIIKRLSMTPLTKMDWILGNILCQTMLNLILTAVMIFIGWVVYNVQAIPDVPSIILIFLGSVMFSGIGMILSGLVKDVEAASAIGNAIAFPMMFLSGTYFPVEFMPSYLQAVAKVLPLTYLSEGLRAAMIYKYPEGIYTNMAIIAVLAAALIVLGSILTRWKEK